MEFAARNAVVGRYRIASDLGEGGMGVVHLAVAESQDGAEKEVALKRCHPHLARDPRFLRLFLAEARIGASISHPNVASVLDVGKDGDSFYIAFELVCGESVRQVMTRSRELGCRVPHEVACRIVADAASGLHAAHELEDEEGRSLGVVHRDVTPHNILVSYDGVTKVVDFGIARADVLPPEIGTRPAFNGKVSYMSPEQARGERLDRRVDVYALGIVLWELTTGRRLFRGRSELETILNALDARIAPPSLLVRGCPDGLDDIVMKALAPSACDRFPTALALSHTLSAMLVRNGYAPGTSDVGDYMQTVFARRIRDRAQAATCLPSGTYQLVGNGSRVASIGLEASGSSSNSSPA
jgi:serine/threonine-protein kinase